jgi:hypothetical protein
MTGWWSALKAWFLGPQVSSPAIPVEDPVQEVRAVQRRCRGPLAPEVRQAVQSALASGLLDLAAQLDAEGRAGCGYDVNELILSQPLDGQLHEAPCPQCGTTIRWIAPHA